MIAKYGKFEYALAEHYRFEDELGRGAMGTVYRARDVRLGRAVAIKMLHPMLTNELGIARFQSEIRIAAGLHHPNIIGVHDSGEADGRLFFVMDYLGGETLRDRLVREKQLSVEDSLAIVEQVAAGLQYAHDHGVVHRDVKPENIILAEGRACVMDFGLARALGDVNTERLTASGMSVGTPHYLSPEQASAEKEVGPKADQYALACVLYEMLVGEPPFTGPTATSIAMRHLSEEPRPLRMRRHTTPQGVETAVMRALEKVPADRFKSVTEFALSSRRTLGADVLSTKAAMPLSEESWARPLARSISARRALLILLVLASGGVAARFYTRRAPAQHVVMAQSSMKVALLPLVARGSPGSARVPAVLEGISGALRVLGGVVAMPLESPVRAEDVESSPGAMIVQTQARGARYLITLADFGERAGGIMIQVFDATTGEVIGRERLTATSASDDGVVGADIGVSIVRAIAARDSLVGLAFRSLLRSTRSSQAILHIIEGQRRFGASDFAGANAEYRRALSADSTCLLALYRLSVSAAWAYDFGGALSIADSGLRRAAGTDERMVRLFRAQRFFAMRMADSAIAAFVASVGDDPDNVDGWLGLGQSMYYFGWVAGFSLADARSALDRVLYIDSTFAPVDGELVDVALASKDSAAAISALRRIGVALPWRRAKEQLVRYAVGGASARDSVLHDLERADQFTLSELVLQFSRLLGDARGADRVALQMQAPRRSPESRHRGAQYRLALSALLDRESDATREVVAGLSGDAFDSWLGAAALSGVAKESRLDMRKAAWTLVRKEVNPSDVTDPSARLVQAIEFLVQDALDDVSAKRAERVMRSLRPLASAGMAANPTITGWRESLSARVSLTRGDTTAAIAALQRATRQINEPYGAFLPLVALPVQRRLLGTLQRASRMARKESERTESSFLRSWSIADALFGAPTTDTVNKQVRTP